MGDACPVDPLLQSQKIQADFLLDDDHARAGGQRRILIHHVGVKAVAGVGHHAGIVIQMVELAIPSAEIGDVPMLQHHALGRACGAGGVQQNKQVFRPGTLRHRFTGGQVWDVLRQQHRPAVVRHLLKQRLVRDQQLRVGILHHEGQALRGIGGIQRLVGCA